MRSGLGNLRKEERPAICVGAILDVDPDARSVSTLIGMSSCGMGVIPEVVSANEGFEARSEIRAAVVLSELDGLIHPTVSVTEVGREGRAKVYVEAFFGARPEGSQRRR